MREAQANLFLTLAKIYLQNYGLPEYYIVRMGLVYNKVQPKILHIKSRKSIAALSILSSENKFPLPFEFDTGAKIEHQVT